MLSGRIFRAGNANVNTNLITQDLPPGGLKCLRIPRKNGLRITIYFNNYGPRYNSSTRWKTRQGKDIFAREARIQGLKSRAAFKLLEIDAKYKLFRKGQTVVDLGYAPGSWSQVAVERTKPTGRVIGIDIIPAQPPKGVSTIQGNFLSKEVQEEVKLFLLDPNRGRPRDHFLQHRAKEQQEQLEVIHEQESYIDMERHAKADSTSLKNDDFMPKISRTGRKELGDVGKMVDVVLSDMSAPWEQTTGFWKKTLSGPYNRMMNTSGINFKDHAGSMDLCSAALQFSYDTLKVGGHFICKFYQGTEDKQLETRLKRLFSVVYREKPESSRSESKEAYFVALRRRREMKIDDIEESSCRKKNATTLDGICK